MKLESEKQRKLIEKYESDGYYVIKLIQTNKNGIPDLILLKDGKCFFIEVKREGEKPKPLQEYRRKELEAKGFEVIVI
jgi:Holliday junction resolvase